MLWSVCAGTRLEWKRWGEDVIIFHENSGNTHCLNPFAAAVLKRLFDGAASTEDLAREASARLSVPYEPQMRDTVAAMLVELKALGITQADTT